MFVVILAPDAGNSWSMSSENSMNHKQHFLMPRVVPVRMSFLCFQLFLIICLAPCVSQFIWLPIIPFVSNHPSPTWSVSGVICLQSYVYLSGGVLSSFIMMSFLSRVCLCSLLPCVVWSSQDKIMFHHPLVSRLAPTLSPSCCLRYKCRKKSKGDK